MVIFKEKKSRTSSNKKNLRVTLDAQHNQKIKGFINKKKKLSKMETQLNNMIENYDKFSTRKNSELSDQELENKLALKEKIDKMKKEIDNVKNNKNMNKYLMNTSKLLFDYYDEGADKSPTNSSNANESKHIFEKKKSVVDFFKKNPINKIKKPKKIDKKKNKTYSKTYSKNEILDNYLNFVDKNHVKNMVKHEYNIDYCSSCKLEKIFFQSEGIMVCPKCGILQKILVDSDKPSYKEPPREISYFAYKRINHFNEWLAQFQAKESTDIPKEVYDKIKAELKKERYVKTSNLKISKIRDILKTLGLNKYYEHVPHIINRLSGKPAPIINRETEEKLRMMFKEIQSPWLKHCPNKRSNFLSYSYVLYKCLQLLEMDEFLKHFTLLKSREKLAEQDKIWRKICHDLRWEYIKTI